MLENSVGNDQPLEAEQDINAATDGKVNPGAIRKSTTSSILNALSQASGQEFQSVEAALAYVARTATQKSVAPLQQVEHHEDTDTRMERGNDETDLREQFQRLTKDLAQKERALAQKELDTEIMRSIGDRFDSDLTDYALQKIKANIKVNRDGSYAIVNNKGQERYAMDGNPLTLKGLIDEVAQGNPKLLKGNSTSSGSGLRPGQSQFSGAQLDGIPDYSRNPAEFNAWAARNGLGKGIGLKATKVTASSSMNTRSII
jgi:hypothetical protein